MTKRMLIDATHSEETRVAIVEGNRLEDFDYESIYRKQLKGGIYLAKVTRVEPSLQAAFVNFGGNRHGFLPFSEIHPDYFKIPVADREALLAEQREALEAQARAEEEEDAEEHEDEETAQSIADPEEAPADEDEQEDEDEQDLPEEVGGSDTAPDAETGIEAEDADVKENEDSETEDGSEEEEDRPRRGRRHHYRRNNNRNRNAVPHRARRVEVVGGEEDDHHGAPRRFDMRRRYKIQEVVKRGQIMLIQVSKEERGNKGAAVTTYLSLPGRYCVLMPNSPRAGGVSRKISSYKDRKRMKEILSDLEVPENMSVILRTAGLTRTKTEIKRDYEYLVRLWNNIRELTLKSSAPALIYEEANLVKRAVRDYYTRDVEEILVAGEDGYKLAKDFMKMLIPSHARRVKEYRDEKIPLFHRYQVESQIAEMGSPSVTLKSGGYLVINPTEALVSIDVNSGRATKERHIEETAIKTNLEAADEVARQLRLRDLGGLVVVDFIDMEDRRNNAKLERRMKDALSNDRARIQVGRISSFGLMELSRQRLNPSLTESQFQQCAHCKGVGYTRTVDSAAIIALRALEEEGIRGHASEITLKIPETVGMYILNHKRDMLSAIEARYAFKVFFAFDPDMPPSEYEIDVLRGPRPGGNAAEAPAGGGADEMPSPPAEQAAAVDDNGEDDETSSPSDDSGSDSKNSSRRRRGRRGGRRRNRKPEDQDGEQTTDAAAAEPTGDEQQQPAASQETPETPEEPEDKPQDKKEKSPRRSRARKPASKPEAEAEAESQPEPERQADSAPVQPSYEVVTESSTDGPRKKGWWNKILES